jgi:D-amino-acid dehydrogenase
VHICVLGAGIVGLATAWQLEREGHHVVVIDRGEPGNGASNGNGAQLSYSYVAPLADSAIWRQLPSLLLSPSSPLKFRPMLDWAQWRWLVSFLRACNSQSSRETTINLIGLAQLSRQAFDAMRAEVDPQCDYATAGKLVIYPTEAGLRHAARQVELQRAFGSVQHVVTAAECVTIEPALQNYLGKIAGGVHTPSECVADCHKLCRELTRVLMQRGVEFVVNTAVKRFHVNRGRIASVDTANGAVEADAFVLALGANSSRYGSELGVTLPVYPLKGYSITLDVDDAQQAAPSVSVTDSARKTVFARLGNRLRVAGLVELVGHDDRVPASRIQALLSATKAAFPRCCSFDDIRPWTGMRPATPSGIPIVGRLVGTPANILFNTGHGALGFTLAFGSAVQIGRAIDALQGA